MDLFSFSFPAPEHIANFGALKVYNEGRGTVLPRLRQLLATGADDRYSDVCGKTVGHIIDQLDWRGAALPYCITAVDEEQVIGAAWATPIVRRPDGAAGCNLSFMLAEGYEGRGVATMLTAIAYSLCVLNNSAVSFANIQSESSNLSAHRVALRLGMSYAPEFDRTATAPFEDRTYSTFRAPAAVVAARCTELFNEIPPPPCEDPQPTSSPGSNP